jgi:hypothetical protein
MNVEHRWGKRIPLDLSVSLQWGPHSLASGRLRNVSLSGAYVEGLPLLPVWTEVYVHLDGIGCGECSPVKAYVIRNEPGGLAVEWSEFAPNGVHRLIGEATVTARRESARDELDSVGFLSRHARDPLQRSDLPPASAVQGLSAALP